MQPVFIYIIQVNFALALFYILYILLFKKDTFLKIKRFYFISIIAFSIVYSLFVVPGLGNIWDFRNDKPNSVESSVMIEAPTMEFIVVESIEDDVFVNVSWEQIISTIYIIVTLFFIFRFIWQLISIYLIRAKSNRTAFLNVEVYNLKNDITPFSFFNMIFINLNMHSEEELKHIIIHEHTHVSEKHSLDIMLVEIILLFSWWNPLVWFLKREMAINLEYLADSGVLTEGVDSRDYQYHLLRLTNHETAVQIVNNFNVSQLKQRIMMMNKNKSSTLKLAKYLFMLPLFFILIAANSAFAGEDEQSKQEPPPVENEELEEIFVVVEQQPEFPGGIEEMMKFLSDSIVYPPEAKEKGIQGRVICNFVVMNDGRIADVQIVRGVDPMIDDEAVRVIESMPDWKPGMQRGQSVNVRFTLPVEFRLNVPSYPEDDTSEIVKSRVIIDELIINGADLSLSAGIQHTPMFMEDNEGFVRYLIENIRYPVIAQENGVQGLVNATIKFSDNSNTNTISFKDKPNSDLEAGLYREVQRLLEDAIKEMEKTAQSDRGGTFLVSGKVTDSKSGPVQGASVILKGTNMGTITDSNGNFMIKVPSKENTLSISFVGYDTRELALNRLDYSTNEITTELPVVFRLQGDNVVPYDGPTPDNAVVVVGYGL